jgi:hypothetical protein
MLRGPLHNRSADGRYTECGESFPCSDAEAIYDQVVRRQLDPNPRCHACKDGPMFHPAHRWTRARSGCRGDDVCGCTGGVD